MFGSYRRENVCLLNYTPLNMGMGVVCCALTPSRRFRASRDWSYGLVLTRLSKSTRQLVVTGGHYVETQARIVGLVNRSRLVIRFVTVANAQNERSVGDSERTEKSSIAPVEPTASDGVVEMLGVLLQPPAAGTIVVGENCVGTGGNTNRKPKSTRAWRTRTKSPKADGRVWPRLRELVVPWTRVGDGVWNVGGDQRVDHRGRRVERIEWKGLCFRRTVRRLEEHDGNGTTYSMARRETILAVQ